MTVNTDKLFESALLAQRSGDLEKALELFAAVILSDPRHAAAWHCRGLVEDKLGRSFNALMHLNQAIALEPHQAVWCNRGIIAGKLDLLEEAHASFAKALEYGNAFEPYQNLGDYCVRTMDLEGAEKAYRNAIKCQPQSAGAHGNLGKVLIQKGKWAEGHKEMLWRHKENPPMERTRWPAWEGQNCDHKTILVYPEGGYGDEILDMRYAVALQKQRPRTTIILEVRPALYRIAKHSLQGIVSYVIPQWDKPPIKPDWSVGVSDIPGFLGINEKTIPLKEGYLTPPFGPIPEMPKGLKVGLCWLTGSRPLMKWTDRIMKSKSIPLAEFSPLFEYTDVTFVCLQLDRADPTVMRRVGMINPMEGVKDLGDTARIVSQLDLTISVDTSIAHLAGAIGKPVWNLIRFDEIVTYPGQHSFYDSMKFYRQTEPNNWRPILQTMFKDFEQWMASRSQKAESTAMETEAAE